MGRAPAAENVNLKKMLILSILVHLLLLRIPLAVFVSDENRALPASEPEEKEMSFVFVETPENAMESPLMQQQTPFISDKNLAAANPAAPQSAPEGQPYQEGESDLAAMLPDRPPTEQPGTPGEARESQAEQDKRETENAKPSGADLNELRELTALSRLAPPREEPPLSLEKQSIPGTPGETVPSGPVAPRYDNRATQSPVQSDFSLSTYNWHWAPYLKELKRRIEKNIYPPPAFYMGIARGRTYLRFKIMPDGTIRDFEVILYSGHESLKSTSVGAIDASVPFLPLPSDFPEDYLGITVGFFYNEFKY